MSNFKHNVEALNASIKKYDSILNNPAMLEAIKSAETQKIALSIASKIFDSILNKSVMLEAIKFAETQKKALSIASKTLEPILNNPAMLETIKSAETTMKVLNFHSVLPEVKKDMELIKSIAFFNKQNEDGGNNE